ncbi:MAG: cryptochrome/photolyase family protein [Pseudomonadota bacterium]
MRNLIVVLGDQLDRHSTVFEGFEPAQDAVWMAEVAQESSHVPSHKARIALFLAAMRHLRDEMAARGWTIHYRALDAHPETTLADALAADLGRLRPRRLVLVKPGDWRVEQDLQRTAANAGVEWTEREDRHFYASPADFAAWAHGRRELRMEFFYRWMRQREGVLMAGREPAGGQWNYDADNRGTFDRRGPGGLPAPVRFAPDATTREVLDLVARRFPGHPGALEAFDWPVTPADAAAALDDFIRHRLPRFGTYQDAMWTGQPWLYHARIAAALNLKLLDPRRAVDAAVQAWRDGHAPLNAVEGFVRQILGWREFVRGVYWLRMPGFAVATALGAERPLPAFYWTGDTDMNCLREVVGQTLALGYAHHIQRLMVTGLFALLFGVRPLEIHAWYLAIYVDAVEWVELPNVLGMSQYADGGHMVSKPYCASGKYIQRMGNYCSGCRYRPERAVGADACPFTTLYWDFLDRHRARFAKHPRTALQWKNLERLPAVDLQAIRDQAAALRAKLAP